MKLGILGGTFDPIHNGHMHMALQAMSEYRLDEVWVMPTGLSPHKPDLQITSCAQRLAMARLAVQDYPNICVSELETNSNERCYTFRTLTQIQRIRPSDELYFIMGADSLAYLDHWVHPEIIMQCATILAAGRDEWEEPQLTAKITQLQQLYNADIRI
ncbi:MAG: nicotinate (nicotinamide) nucleotide adenylyltransferase, partial [Clostridiales bacterium]|nr:nicotinate (nicotinamide) nucleotide adenylyltransferase [Clostridiales bacterium]